jgi:DNA-binding NtrC family response regulator
MKVRKNSTIGVMETPFTRTARGGAPLAGPVCVLVVSGPDRGARFDLVRGSAIVGTQPDCQLRLKDPTVSRQHLKLAMSEEGVVLSDLGSRNGTWVNGLPIKESGVVLGARVRIGETQLQIVTSSPTEDFAESGEYQGLLGKTPVMHRLFGMIRRVAPSDATVLLTGETGTGKDRVARAIHTASGRTGRLITFDCAALNEGVMASELFGHVAGAFTGAKAAREGAVERAAAGTLFLDEVAELDISLQPAFLRLLEAKEIRPVGGSVHRHIDVRIIAATHKDLAHEVEKKNFREDLFHRLSVLALQVPPLRERREDIPLLAEHLASELGQNTDLGERALETLKSYDWPGNIRELRNVIQRTLLLGEPVDPKSVAKTTRGATSADVLELDFHAAREAVHLRFEREYLIHLLERNAQNVSQAARVAGLARGYLYRLLKKHDLV